MNPDQIKAFVDKVVEIQELTEKLKKWEACADNLVDYAHEFVTQLSTWGRGYDRNDKQIKLAEDAIEQYNRLKNREPVESIKPSADEPAWKSWNWPTYTPFTPKK